MIFHVNTCGTARSQREITGLPAFAAAPRPSPGLAPWSVRIKDLYFPSGPGATGLYRCSPGTAGTAVSGCRYDRPADRPGEDLIATAFGDGPRNPVTDQLARFALAAIDGAFVAIQADHGATLGRLLEPLAPSLVASRRALLAGQGREGQAQAGRRI